MTLHTGTWVARNSLNNGTTARDARLADAGLIAKNANGTIRTGVLADGQGPVVTGAAGMSYNIRKFVAVTSAGETQGAVLVPNDGNVSVSTDPAPGSNSRIDVIYVLQNFITGDGGTGDNNTPEFGVARGAASATPSAPAIPTGGLELARVTVTAGTQATSGLTFTQGPRTTVIGALSSGWVTLNVPDSNFQAMTGFPVQIRRDGDHVKTRGRVQPKTGTWAANLEVWVGSLPTGMAPLVEEVQGSGTNDPTYARVRVRPDSVLQVTPGSTCLWASVSSSWFVGEGNG
jgi:hypothetical protein